MTPEAMKERTKRFALSIVNLEEGLAPGKASGVIGGQLLRAATSVGANYRAACRARSRAEFAAKMGIVEEEADESQYWLELLVDGHFVPLESVGDLLNEAGELTAIAAASRKTAKGRSRD